MSVSDSETVTVTVSAPQFTRISLSLQHTLQDPTFVISSGGENPEPPPNDYIAAASFDGGGVHAVAAAVVMQVISAKLSEGSGGSGKDGI